VYSYELACAYNGIKGATSTVSFNLNAPVPLSVSLTPAAQGVVPNTPASFSWSIVGDNSGGCTASVSGAPAPHTTNWPTLFSGTNDPRTGNYTVNSVPTGSLYTFTISCLDSSARRVEGSAVVNSPPQCSDGLDNDADTFIDLIDRGCTNAADNTEEGESVCVVDNICQARYGETPISCPADCKIDRLKDQ
jgi:hypothetical protein